MSWDAVEKYLVESRYAVKDPSSGEPLEHSYDDIASRIISILASDIMSDVLRDRLVILATPALMSLGNPYTKRHGYFSCYPLGHVEDTLSGIELTHQKMRTIYTAGGGVGIDLSKLRPNGSPVDNGQGTASGPVGFLPDFDSVTGTTNQGGRRRGALLVQLDWEHPDIRDFVQIKNFNHTFNRLIQQLPPEERPSKGFSLTNMNISVNVYGKFWENDQLIDLIARNMWATGDPGLLFVDNMIKHSPFPADLEPKFSNPCGEYLAPAGSACNLVTVNVAKLATEAQNKTHFFSFTVQHGPNRLRFGQYHVGYG